MQAIILAAGMGKRLKNLTSGNTKCMVQVNGITLIERLLLILDKKHLNRIIIVVGYEGTKLIEYVAELKINTPIKFVENPIYDKTNNIYSLSLAKNYLIAEDTLLFESDLIFEESIVDALLEDSRETLALVDKFESWMDGTCMVLDEEDGIKDFLPGKYLNFSEKELYYKTVNIYKFSKHFSANTYVPFLEAYSKAMGNNEYYESVIKLIALLETKEIRAKKLNGQLWYEIDDIQDLDIASTLFANSTKEKYDAIISRFGGYWRYPKLLDFCYLVNPYYPTEKMLTEIKSNFNTLITQYPSGMRVNTLLAARNFEVNQEYIVIGNGAAELIKELMKRCTGRIGIIRPTFEEYPNRVNDNNIIVFKSINIDFSYNADELIDFFGKQENSVSSIILINPDNPTGNYIPHYDLLKLVRWCKQENVKLIIDESFVDFSTEEISEINSLTLINDQILNIYDGLYVVKSISKSYGVPGIRLGVMASSNTDIITELKKSLPIWNINSFGEFYMQIFEKYRKDYLTSLEEIKASRENLFVKLNQISFLKALPSQANYIMCEVTEKYTSIVLAYKLLEYNILIKDLSPKINNGKQYIRIAVRTFEDNKKLIDALQNL